MTIYKAEIPVVIPVFTVEGNGNFALESFVNAQVCVSNLKENLTSNNSCIIGYLPEWIRWEMTDNIPLCITVDGTSGHTTAYTTGMSQFKSLKQCMAKLRLSNVTRNGDVVAVERAVFIRSYSIILSYLLDAQERVYKIETCTHVPSYMTAVKEYAEDEYTLMNIAQKLREKQIAACADTLLLVVLDHKGRNSIWTYKTSKQNTHFAQKRTSEI